MPSQQPRLHRLVYASRAEPDPPRTEQEVVAEILAAARRNNPRHGLTGALLHGAGGFVQVLEGQPQAVAALVAAIRRDPRHSAMTILEVTAAKERLFANWSMAYLSDLDLIPEAFAQGNATLLLLLRLRDLLRTGVSPQAAAASPAR
jgi:hypothetical protein